MGEERERHIREKSRKKDIEGNTMSDTLFWFS